MIKVFVDARGVVEVRSVGVDDDGDLEIYIKKPASLQRGGEWINLEACQLSPEDLARVRDAWPHQFELAEMKRGV